MIEQTVDIPLSHRLVIDVPPEVPAGRTVLAFTPVQEEDETVDADWFENGGECPLCAMYTEPNEETIAAIREGRAMMRGEIPVKSFHSLEELLADLRS